MSKKIHPYPKRSWLMTWLRLPFQLCRIRFASPATAAEVIRYIEQRRSRRMTQQPMRIILAALRRRAAEGK
jgi:hypothetical protein